MIYNFYFQPLLTLFQNSIQKQLDAFAGHLGVPPVWVLQMLHSDFRPDAVHFEGATLLAHAILQHAFQNSEVTQMLEELTGIKPEGEVAEMCTCSLKEFEKYRDQVKDYYDFYAISTWPEMIGQPEDWVLESEAGPLSKAAFKEYVRSTVPPEQQAQVFGEAA